MNGIRPIARFGTMATALLVLSGCGGEPFPIVKVSGVLTYEDGGLLPAQEGEVVGLLFFPQTPPLNASTNPRPGSAQVNVNDGSFDSATTHSLGDGLVRGLHKVVICGRERDVLPPGVPPEYGDLETTPLEVDAASQPMRLTIRRP